MNQQAAVPAQPRAGEAGRPRMSIPFLLLVLVAGMLLIPTGGASAAGWLAPVNVSATWPNAKAWNVSFQDVGVDGQGDAVAVWVSEADAVGTLRTATRPAGGVWSSSGVVTTPGEEVLAPKLIVNSDGDAAVEWLGYNSKGHQIVRVATRPAGGEWSEPTAVSDPEGFSIEPDIAIDDQGNVMAIWSKVEGSDFGVVETATHPAAGEWSDPVELSDGGANSSQIAVDPEGDVTALWVLVSPNRDDGIVQSKTRPAGGDWASEAVDVSDAGALASRPRFAVDAQGDAVAVWQRRDIPAANGFHMFVQTAARADGAWSAPIALSKEDGLATNPEVTVDPQGNATGIWSTFPLGDGPRTLTTRYRTAEGVWESPVDLVNKIPGFTEPQETGAEVVADAQGNVTAIWTAWQVPTYVVRSARRPAGGAWSTPVDVSAPGASAYSIWPQMATDPQGDVTVVWSGLVGSNQAVRSRVFDTVAPELRDLDVPATGIVGQAVPMSVDPFDVWSPVASAWGFGDGRSGTGATVNHCYSSPGEHTVTITGTDLAANATSASRTISIEPDPALAPGSDPCNLEPPDDPGPLSDLPPPGPSGHPNPNPEPGPTAPIVSDLQQSSSRWRTPGARDRSPLPVGTTFRFKLDRSAAVRLAFSRIAAGREEGAHCIKPTKANDKAPRCARYQARGALETAGEAGENTYGFRGRIRGRTLEPGRYRLLVTALADGETSAVASIGFAILR